MTVAQTSLPTNAKLYLPDLRTQIQQVWPTMPAPQYFAGQVEQETCISLTWSSCWNPHTDFKTSREYGFGLGQLTITPAFNNFTALQQMKDPVIRTWKWTNRFDPNMQIRAMLDMDLVDFNAFEMVGLTPTDQYAFMFSAYNGGAGGLEMHIQYCYSLPMSECNHRIWFNNVATHSWKSRVRVAGYGQSFFDINREYVSNILDVRSQKYLGFFDITTKP